MNDDHNEDWVKGTWDIRTDGFPVTRLPELLRALGVSNAPAAAQKDAIARFVMLPAAAAMPESLAHEVHLAYPAVKFPVAPK